MTLDQILEMAAEDYADDPALVTEIQRLRQFRAVMAAGRAQAERVDEVGRAVAEHNRSHGRASRRSYRRGLSSDTIRTR